MTRQVFETFEELLDSMGVCGACEKPVVWKLSEAEQQELLAAHNRMDEGLSRIIRRMRPLCEACEKMGEQNRAELIRGKRVAELRQKVYGLGWLPEGARDCTFDDSSGEVEDNNQAAWRWGRLWTPEHPNGWVMGGEGTGKTFFVRCILNAAISRVCEVLELSAIELNRSAARFDSDTLLKQCCNTGILSIDDVDKAEWTAKGFEWLWLVAERRHDAKRRFFMTSNVTPEAMKSVWAHLAGDNPTKLSTLFARFIPMERIELKGASIRRAIQTELVGVGSKAGWNAN
jgi:DNA replication protein DnaC